MGMIVAVSVLVDGTDLMNCKMQLNRVSFLVLIYAYTIKVSNDRKERILPFTGVIPISRMLIESVIIRISFIFFLFYISLFISTL